MKKKPLILLIFLLSLCLIPPTFAVYGDESPQSITSFAETLPDDVLFYPDAFLNTTLATDGDGSPSPTGSYTDTHVKDGSSYFTIDASSPYDAYLALDFTLLDVQVEYINIALYASFESTDGAVTTRDLLVWNGTDWVDCGDIQDGGFGSTFGWTNVTLTDSNYIDFNDQVLIRGHGVDNAILTLSIDYAEVTFAYMTLADADHYAESFADVSDWTQTNGETWGTDGDRMYVDVPYDAGSDFYYTDSISFPAGSYYWELRAETNISYSSLISVTVYDTDGQTGNNKWLGNYYYTSAGQTRKSWFDFDYGIESVALAFTVPVAAGEDARYYTDYFRIFQGNESGMQHDGSTTTGVTEYSGSVSSDGDLVTVSNVSGDAGAGIFFFDTTSTIAKSEDIYYPFVSINVATVEAGTTWNLGYATTDTPSVWGDFSWWIVDETTTGTFRVNLASLSLGTSNIAVLSQDGAITVDYIKIYSIANFTVTEISDEAITDVLYVDSNVIYSSGITVDFVELRLDPEISVIVDTYNVWTASISSGSANFRFRETVDNSNYFSTGVIQGSLTSTILEEFQFLFYGACALSAIKFIDTHDWQDVGEARFIFPIGWDPTFIFGYDAFFIFLGLIMIPLSTMYLVRGGREEMSADKLFYGLIIFAVGFGLLVGGIMP